MEPIEPMTKMWISFFAMGLMVLSAIIVTFARIKTKGLLRIVLITIALIMLLISFIYGLVAMGAI